MTLQDLASIFNIFAAVALVVSAVFLFLELRENNRLARASNTQSLVALSSAFLIPMIQDSKMAELYLHGASQEGKLSPADQFRYRTMVTWWLVFHENIFYQHRQGLLDEHSYQPWAADLVHFIEQQHLLPWWDSVKHLFQAEFADLVTARIAECRARVQPSGSH